jgi:demethylmenaquinone methyltransferase/2-methoxy-6-polyprenyl-1,4-benzoquinol methylase
MSNDPELSDRADAHDIIARYYADPVRRLALMRDLFNRSARYYDPVNRLFSLGSGAWYRRACLRDAGVQPGCVVVDVAVGTGLLAREAVGLTGDARAVIGVDVSEAMLSIARARLGIALVQGAAEALPLASACADFVTMGYALRHIADLHGALREARRVLRPGGTVVLLEISPPRKRLNRMLAAVYIGRIIPALALLTTRNRRARALMRYHWQTIVNMMPPEIVIGAMEECGFEVVDCRTELDLFRCYRGRRPLD